MIVYKIKYFIILLIFLSLSLNLNAQKKEPNYRNGWVIGYQLNEFGHDFGVGLTALTPAIYSRIHFNLSYDYQYLRYQANAGEDWKPYQQVRLGFITKAPIIKGKIDVYGGGGLVLGFLPNSMDSDTFRYGGSGTFGFSLYWYEGFTYFFEMGGTGGLGSASKLESNPLIGNGFYKSVGFRVHFK
jgi:hypothetical protein